MPENTATAPGVKWHLGKTIAIARALQLRQSQVFQSANPRAESDPTPSSA
jgi:hypothetical protein